MGKMNGITSGETLVKCDGETGVCQARDKECDPGADGVCCKGASGWPVGWVGAKLCKVNPYNRKGQCRDCLWKGERCAPNNDKCCTSGNEDTVCRHNGNEYRCAGSPGDRLRGERCSKNSDCSRGQTRGHGIYNQCKDGVCKQYYCRTIRIKAKSARNKILNKAVNVQK